MRVRTVRAALAAVVLAGTTGFLAYSATGSASADTTMVTLPADNQYFFPALIDSLGDLLVDGVHRRLIASDPKQGLIAAARYDGSFPGSTVQNLPGVTGLALSTDSATLYAALPGQHAIVSVSTTTDTETARFPLGDEVTPADVVVAGGRLWFSYRNPTGAGGFGSLDPADGTVHLHSFQAISDYHGAPLIASSAAAPNLLALSDGGSDSGSNVTVYDVGTGVEQLAVPRRTIDDLNFLSGLAFTADGSQLIVAGSGGATLVSSTDPSLGENHFTDAGTAVSVASDGRIAAATQSDLGVADVLIYPAGSTTAEQTFDMPYSEFPDHPAPDRVMTHGLAWEPNGPRLFVVTENNGTIGFRALNEPPKVTPVITLTPPATAARAASLTIAGTISGAVPAGAELVVERKDLDSSQTRLAPTAVGAGGRFSVIDKPPAGGAVTYTVLYSGDSDHLPASATTTVNVSRTSAALTLNRNATVNNYGVTVSLTAHLGTFYRNKTVEILADPNGSDLPVKSIKTGVVDAKGNVTVNYRLVRNTIVAARFTGDSHYNPVVVKSTLYTRAAVATALTKSYQVKSGYYQFHKTANPRITTTMNAYPKRQQKLMLEYYSGGKWLAWHTYFRTLTSAGTSIFDLTGSHTTGVKYRVRPAYLSTSADNGNYSTYGSYRYFTFTK